MCSAVVSINAGNTRLVCSAVLWFLLMPETQDLFCDVCGIMVSIETGNTRLVLCSVQRCDFCGNRKHKTCFVLCAMLWFLLIQETQDVICFVCSAAASINAGNTRRDLFCVQCSVFY